MPMATATSCEPVRLSCLDSTQRQSGLERNLGRVRTGLSTSTTNVCPSVNVEFAVGAAIMTLWAATVATKEASASNTLRMVTGGEQGGGQRVSGLGTSLLSPEGCASYIPSSVASHKGLHPAQWYRPNLTDRFNIADAAN